MNRFFTLLLAASCLTAVGQTEYPYPYNPDGNNDGYISLNDLLDLLSVYGSEFNAGVLATDSVSAIFYTGEMDYWDCASSCVGLKGNWKVLDHHLIGSYRELLSETEDPPCWLDHTQFDLEGDVFAFPVLTPYLVADADRYPNDASIRCFCQTRTRADIEDINVCEGLEDECGVCNGEGAIYECGCSDIPEGDCDCEGNQLDAIGVCGGDCLEDADGDGVCDPVLGPCEGQDYMTYHGVDYEIVETADGRCWFAEDLSTDKYNDGNAIEFAPSEDLWQGDCSFVSDWQDWYCCLAGNGQYSDLSELSNPYVPSCGNNGSSLTYLSVIPVEGFLYNFQAVETGLLCPQGWSVPTASEWQQLLSSYGGEREATIALSSAFWLESNLCGSANAPVPMLEWDSSGMSLAGRGRITSSFGHWEVSYGHYWSSTLENDDFQNTGAKGFYLGSPCGTIGGSGIGGDRFRSGRSVRCIKD